MYREILVPTDGSDPARAAIDHAVTLAGLCDARVHGLFVTDSGTADKIEGKYPQPADQLESVGEEAITELERVATSEGVETTVHIAGGTAHEEIVQYADENDIDVIVMGTRGRQGVDRYLLGSVTERVVRTADQAVLTVDESTPAHPAD
jgi:nucleotide-binding universal stress UspA family protein